MIEGPKTSEVPLQVPSSALSLYDAINTNKNAILLRQTHIVKP